MAQGSISTVDSRPEAAAWRRTFPRRRCTTPRREFPEAVRGQRCPPATGAYRGAWSDDPREVQWQLVRQGIELCSRQCENIKTPRRSKRAGHLFCPGFHISGYHVIIWR